MKIFLTGATGYVGSVVAEKLLENGHEVIGLVRNEEGEKRLREKGVEPLRGDLADFESLKKGAAEADGVIHTAFGHDFANYDKMVDQDINAVNAIVEVLQGTNKPLIATSAPGFLGDTGETLADENYPIDENSPFAVRVPSERNILDAAEKGVRAVVLRLPFYVYGRGGSTFAPFLLQKAREHGAAFFAEDGTEKTSAAHVDDVARAYVLALENENAQGVYHIVENNYSNREIAEAIGKNLGVEAQSISKEAAGEKFAPLSGFFTVNNRISGEKAQRKLGWKPEAELNLLEDIARGSYASKV